MARPAKKAIIPEELSSEIATTRDGQDITQPWVGLLQQPRDPRLLASVDWGVYDKIAMDDQVKMARQQRVSAVVAAEWDVLAGDDKDPRSVAAAVEFKAMMGTLGWDHITKKMLNAPFHGIAIAELIWGNVNGKPGFVKIKVRHARRFRYDNEGNLRLLSRSSFDGKIVPERKFWVVTDGADNDDEPYGHGLADWLYWPVLFKRNGIRFWNIFLDKFGSPTAVAKYRRGTPKADIDKLVQMLQALATDSGIVVPDGVAVDFLQAARSGTADHEKLVRYMDECIAKIILGQTMTSADGASLSQAQVHAGVKLEFVKADADLQCDSFNEGPSRWWTDLNYGTDVAAPRLVRLVEEEVDIKMLASTDAIHDRLGWRRTVESFNDTYGKGYERKPEAIVVPQATGKVDSIAADNASFAEPEASKRDIVDDVAEALLKSHGWRPLTPVMKTVLEALEASDNPDDFNAALLEALPPSDREGLTEILARAGFAMRLSGAVGG